MNRLRAFGLPGLCLAGVLLLALATDLPAQQQKGKKEVEAKQKAAGEQIEQNSDKNGRQQEPVVKAREMVGRPIDQERAPGRYRPRRLQAGEAGEWKDGIPPGWSRGDKQGWGGADAPPGQGRGGGEAQARSPYPPGAKDWDGKRREDWDRRLERARERVREKAQRAENAGPDDVASADISLQEAAREGVPIEDVESAVSGAIAAGMKGPEIEQMTRAMAYGASQGVGGGRLGAFASSRIEAGERGDDLAVSIYQEADRLQEEQEKERPASPPEGKKTSWWQKIFRRQ